MKKLIPLFFLIALITTGCSVKFNGANGITNKEFIVGGERVVVGSENLGAELSNFVPEITLYKWGDETSIRIWTDDEVENTATEVGDKIISKSLDGEKEYNFYPIDEGFEYEVILLEKPNTNVITLNIELKDLICYYQPELTQEEIDGGAFRPENVIGSYACYHSTKKNHIIGQTNYMAGKAFHIYRPQMEDANGVKVWGELNITGDILSVEIPQDFLDKAVYPIRHASGLEFGNTNAGASSTWFSLGVGSEFTSPAGAETIIDLRMSCAWEADGNQVKATVYSGGLGNDLTLVESKVGGASAVGSSKGWITSTFGTAVSISGSTNYVLAMYTDADNLVVYFDSSATIYQVDIQTGSFASPDTFLEVVWNEYLTDNLGKISIYATYTAGGASDTCTPDNTGVWAIDLTDNCTTSEDFFSDFGVECYNSGKWAITEGTTVRVASSSNCMPFVRGAFVVQP